MEIKNARRWSPEGVKSYGIAVLGVLLALTVRMILHPVLGANMPFLTFFIAVLFTEYFLGLAAALVAITLSIPLAFYFFVPPFASFDLPEPMDIVIIVGTVISMLLSVALIETLQRARYRAHLLGEIARSRYDMLVQSNTERQTAVAVAKESREHLESFVAGVPEVWYMHRLGGGFEYVNARLYDLSGAPPGSLSGQARWLTVMHAEDADAMAKEIEKLVHTGGSTISRFRLIAGNSDFITFEGQLSCVNDERGKLVKWTGQPIDDELQRFEKARAEEIQSTQA